MNVKNTVNRYFGILCIFPCINLFLSSVSVIFVLLTGNKISTFYTLFAIPQFLLPTLSLLVFLLLGDFLVGERSADSGSAPINVSDTILLTGIFCGVAFLLEMISLATSLFFEVIGHPLPDLSISSFMPNTAFEAFIFIFVIALLPAIVEEFIYRLEICGTLSKYSTAGAVVVSSIAFGIMHGSLQQLLYAVAAGLFFGYVFVRTKNVFFTILLHFINNFTSCILLFISEYMGMEAYGVAYVLKTVFCIVVGAVCLTIYIVKNKKHPKPERTETVSSGKVILSIFKAPFFYVFTALEIFMMIINM